MRPIHNRMPVIIAQAEHARWLDRNNKAKDVTDLLKPFDAGLMEAWEVSSRVNKPSNDDQSLIDQLK